VKSTHDFGLTDTKRSSHSGRTFGRATVDAPNRAELQELPYFGGAGVNTSRLRPGSGLGLGLGAFLTSFLPLSLHPMGASVTQKGLWGEVKEVNLALSLQVPVCIPMAVWLLFKGVPREIPGLS
jgi:hypothetical protein